MLKIANLLLQKNKIPFDKEELSFQIQSHPSYPSLHAITGVFDHFNIENIAARVPVDHDTLIQLPDCFIAQLNGDKGPELFLVEKNKNEYALFDQEKKKEKATTAVFLERFTGIVVAVEKDEHSETKVVNKNLVSQIAFSLLAVSFLFLLYKTTDNIVTYMSFLLAAVGVFLSISIIKQELGIKNTLGDAFCSSEDEKKDCNAVLSSKGATILGDYKLSDFSIIYFVGLGLGILLLSLQSLSLDGIFFISLLSLPITLYSIYYQAVTLKKWCFLCISIVAVLWAQAVVFFYFQAFQLEFRLIEAVTIATSFLFIFAFWSVFKPGYHEALDNKKLKIEYFKFKRNYNLFDTVLKSKNPIGTKIEDVPEIIFGNKDADLEIVIVTNPFCGHCKPVHELTDTILQQYKDLVKIIVRFNINTAEPEDILSKITLNLLRIYLQKGEYDCLIAMGEIYKDNKRSSQWLKKWEDPQIDIPLYLESLTQQKKWCEENKINFTPEILINGYSYPKEYDRADLIFFIEDLYEATGKNESSL